MANPAVIPAAVARTCIRAGIYGDAVPKFSADEVSGDAPQWIPDEGRKAHSPG